jgi:uncharacterized membrane protein YuzA (DUF378 family)
MMEAFKRFEPLALVLLIIGALNWGILGISDGETNVLSQIFGTGTLTDVVYVLVGLAGLIFVPKLMEMLHLGHGPRPHGV